MADDNMGGVRELLKSYGVRPEKTQGQHFLVDDDALNFAVECAELGADDVVLEVGAGIGNLTEHLLPHCKRVIAVETDPRFVSILRDRFAEENIEIIHGDAMQVDIPSFDRCVSNIPYEISSPFLELLAERTVFSIVMFQKAFADRLVADPGTDDYSRISIRAQFSFTIQPLLQVSREQFYPQPEVDSTLVRLRPRTDKPDVDEELFFLVTKALFTHKRKKVRNAIVDSAHILGMPREHIKALDLPHAHDRVVTLTIPQLAEIANAVKGIA